MVGDSRGGIFVLDPRPKGGGSNLTSSIKISRMRPKIPKLNRPLPVDKSVHMDSLIHR